MNLQAQLNDIAAWDNYLLIHEVNSWSNHRPLLLLALALTKGDVIEFGAGGGSTEYLRNYCAGNERRFFSYDYNKEWAEKYNAIYIEDWSAADIYNPCSVAFVDESPGENRILTIERMKDLAEIIVIHDTEIDSAADYKFEKIWHLYKYKIGYGNNNKTAGTTAVSNTIDLSKFDKLMLGQFKLQI